MLDPKRLRSDLAAIHSALLQRGFELDCDRWLLLEKERKELQIAVEKLQNQRKVQSKQIGQAKAKGESIAALMATIDSLGNELDIKKHRLQVLQEELHELLLSLPNIPHETVPVGQSEEDNQELSRWSEPTQVEFQQLDHMALGELRQELDSGKASQITGSRFTVLYAGLARLHRALVQFMLDVHINQHGYQEVYVPYIVSADSLEGTGQLPKFAEDLFKIDSERSWYLIPTAEVPVTNLVRESIQTAAQLPLRWVAHTPCFRSEAGSYGKDIRGLIRQHQFEKVELVQIVKPETAATALEELTHHAETILELLELPYRRVALCTGDLGFASQKTYDLEVWLPGQQAYREISSCSWFGDFQARRMQARWRPTAQAKPEFVHTLNGSGVAVGRALVAILENHQTDETGKITIPAALRPYLGGCELL